MLRLFIISVHIRLLSPTTTTTTTTSVGNGFEYRIEYLILSNSKFSNLTDIRKCRIPKSNYSKMSNI